MKASLILRTALALALGVSVADAQDVLWSRTFGGSWMDGAHSAAATSDGGLIVVGFSGSFTPTHQQDVYLVRTDAQGNALWSRTYGADLNEIGACVQQTSDGGFVVAGRRGVQDHDSLLLRIDADGNLLWERTYDAGDDDRAHAVRETSDGGFVLTGQAWFGIGIFGNYDFYVVKTDAAGNLEWTGVYKHEDSGNDVALAIEEIAGGGYIIGGTTQSSVWDAMLVRTDALGNELWKRTYGGSFADECNDLRVTSDGGFVLTGAAVSPGNGDTDLLLVRTDADGNVLWELVTGGPDGTMAEDSGNCVRELPDGGFAVAGMTSAASAGSWDVYVVRTTAAGNVLWTKKTGGAQDDRGHALVPLADGALAVAGWAWSYGAGNGDVWLLAIDDPCSAPESYCTTSPNSAGAGALMGWSGSPSLLHGEFTLMASGAPAGQTALFFYGSSTASAPMGDGLRCVDGAMFRLSPPAVVDGSGHIERALDFDAPPAGAGPGAIGAGSTRYFQLWYRDPSGGPAGFNLSDGLEVRFCP